ncbi:MAG TPA: pyridoxamine 5'-phosphate oxidase family protein [Chloroflexota bacterium]|nr:pyridoxamine 5'-phosphate oxidase family protein [Chloroflexota bacterium]
MKQIVSDQALGFVATVCPDGTPNVSPKGTLAVWDGNHLVFADIRSPATIANLRTNPAVEINVVDVFDRRGFRFKGTAQVIESGELFHEIMTMYREGTIHDPLRDAERRVRCFVLVRVERVRSLVSPAYDDGATVKEVTGEWIAYWRERYPGER